jgi:hypothetical protein
MRKMMWVVVLAGGCATTSPTGVRVASNDPMAFDVPPPAECQSVRTKKRGFTAAALSSLGVAAGTGVAAAATGGDGEHAARVGLGATAIGTGAVALATGLAAWAYDAKADRCSR